MSIRVKIILIVLPLLVATLMLTSIASSFSARNGITRVAVRLLAFKAQSLRNYLASQWDLLSAQGLEEQPEYREAVRQAGDSFARTLLESPTERILALDGAARAVLFTGGAGRCLTRRPSASCRRCGGGGRAGWRWRWPVSPGWATPSASRPWTGAA